VARAKEKAGLDGRLEWWNADTPATWCPADDTLTFTMGSLDCTRARPRPRSASFGWARRTHPRPSAAG